MGSPHLGVVSVLFRVSCSVLLSDVGVFFCLFKSLRLLVSSIRSSIKPVSPSISLGALESLSCDRFCLTLSLGGLLFRFCNHVLPSIFPKQ